MQVQDPEVETRITFLPRKIGPHPDGISAPGACPNILNRAGSSHSESGHVNLA